MSRFTVVIPNHNYGKWVANAINSVCNDPYKNKQIIVIDDGSTDNSWEVICKTLNINSKYKSNIIYGSVQGVPAIAKRIALVGGPSAARNTAINMMWEHTDIFGFLDSDDEYRDGKITKSVNKLNQHNNIGAVYTDYDIIDEQFYIRREYKEPFSRERLVGECIVHSACCVKKEIIEICGKYDETLRVAEDYDMWLRISERYCFAHIPEPLMLVRVGSHNSTSTVKSEVWNDCHRRVMQKMQDRTKNG